MMVSFNHFKTILILFFIAFNIQVANGQIINREIVQTEQNTLIVTLIPSGISDFFAVSENFGGLEFSGAHTADNYTKNTFVLIKPRDFLYVLNIPENIQGPVTITGKWWTNPNDKKQIADSVINIQPKLPGPDGTNKTGCPNGVLVSNTSFGDTPYTLKRGSESTVDIAISSQTSQKIKLYLSWIIGSYPYSVQEIDVELNQGENQISTKIFISNDIFGEGLLKINTLDGGAMTGGVAVSCEKIVLFNLV